MTLSHYVIHYRPNKNATFYFSKVFGVAILLISLASRRGLIVKTYSVSQDSPRGQKIESWLHLLREMFVRLEYVSFDEPTDCALTARIEHRTL